MGVYSKGKELLMAEKASAKPPEQAKPTGIYLRGKQIVEKEQPDKYSATEVLGLASAITKAGGEAQRTIDGLTVAMKKAVDAAYGVTEIGDATETIKALTVEIGALRASFDAFLAENRAKNAVIREAAGKLMDSLSDSLIENV